MIIISIEIISGMFSINIISKVILPLENFRRQTANIVIQALMTISINKKNTIICRNNNKFT